MCSELYLITSFFPFLYVLYHFYLFHSSHYISGPYIIISIPTKSWQTETLFSPISMFYINNFSTLPLIPEIAIFPIYRYIFMLIHPLLWGYFSIYCLAVNKYID